MDYVQAVILAFVQGVTEWLPISSSGHLVIFQKVLGVTVPVSFDVLLHFGTLLSVVFFLRSDLSRIASSILSGGFRSDDGKLALYVVLATVPAGLVGFLYKDFLESLFSSLHVVAGGLLFTGLLLFVSKGREGSNRIGGVKAFMIGLMQAVSIVPGVSRSGSTISCGLMLGVKREAAARFSFLMSIPVIFGAVALDAGDFMASGLNPTIAFVGFAVSAIVGYFSLKLIWKTILEGRFHVFAYYCWFVGLLLIVSQVA
ncbi:MAG: undecaprenyl-diphosphate phosphatase [Candidatus Altiarchaeota archaeon]